MDAVPGSGGLIPYSPVSFILTVTGAAVSLPLELLPPLTTVFGLVADGSSGLPIEGATVAISGTAVDGHSFSMQVTSEAGGDFRAVIPEGTYTVVATAAGYVPIQEQLAISGASSPLVLAMNGLSTPASGPGGTIPAVGVELLVAAAVVLVGAGVVIIVRRSGKPGAREPDIPAPPQVTPEDEP